jgi:hypothetical protein
MLAYRAQVHLKFGASCPGASGGRVPPDHTNRLGSIAASSSSTMPIWAIGLRSSASAADRGEELVSMT